MASSSPRIRSEYDIGANLLRLGLLFIGMFCVCMLINGLIANIFPSSSRPGFYLSSTMQNIVAFAMPSIFAVLAFTPRPLHWLKLDAPVSWRALLGVVVFYAAGIPALNQIIYWNAHMQLPESMSAIEQALRTLEEQAAHLTESVLGSPSVWNMIVAILVVGILTGLCEELLFRGALMQMIGVRGRRHLAIWTSAIVFSFVHFQFFGFIPRMLLGAWLGYLMYWTGSIWTNAIAHALNNSIVVVTYWLISRGAVADEADMLGVTPSGFPWTALLSAAVFAVLLIYGRDFFFSPANKERNG